MERMTDTSWNHYKQDAEWSRADRRNITAELDRARAKEKRLTEELKKRGETIKALAARVELELQAHHDRHAIGTIRNTNARSCTDGRCKTLADLLRLTET